MNNAYWLALLASIFGSFASAQEAASPSQDAKRLILSLTENTAPRDDKVFATVGSWSNGVRTDGQNPLGEFAPIEGTSNVAFKKCGSDTPDIIPAELVLKTSEICGSVPGLPLPSFPRTAAKRWKLDPATNHFQVSASSDGIRLASVDCTKLPPALLITAQTALDGSSTVAGSQNALARFGVSPDNKTEVAAETRTTPELCQMAPEFWTVETAMPSSAPDPSLKVLGVSSERPPIL
ncbi:hypothetical protein H1W37_08320 [Stappia taiwanensis]|uniref:Uncharacterized protein n=1 Tax=Stappia taiwanensis TaxID=992267 RepID=A0A838XN97_9HYPH|nr:hypothetical protein [Stappia taiwanensis]MBA4611652.1 hypothetical protein [Stappia taiwanensis]GGE97831.1 hypothetical protein GCM10007285_26880 [Stappia taiwanensis]